MLSLTVMIAAIASSFSHASAPISQGINYVGIACMQVTRADGSIEDIGCSHNLITNIGLEMLKQSVNGTAGYWNLTNLTAGGNTSAMAATDTDLANIFLAASGLGPKSAIYTRIGNGNSSLNYEWTALAISAVNSTGIYNTTLSPAKLFAEASWTPSTTLQINDKLNVTYYWWIA